MDYQYQGVNGSGQVVTWHYPTPDPAGAHAGEAVTDVVQINDPPVAGEGGSAEWSGNGITGSFVPTEIALGTGTTGERNGTTLTIRHAPTLEITNWDGTLVYADEVSRIRVRGGVTVSYSGQHDALVTVANAVRQPVHGVTIRDLPAYDTDPLMVFRPNTEATFGEYDGDPTALTAGARVLVAFEDVPARNGIYVSDGTYLVPDTDQTWAIGDLIPVTTGRTWANTMWVCTGTAPPTFAPVGGLPNMAAIATLAPVEIITEEDRWFTLLTITGPSGVNAAKSYLRIDVEASYYEPTVGPRLVKASGLYWGNPAGDLLEFGDPLIFGPVEEPIDLTRFRVSRSGATVQIQALADPDSDPSPLTYQYRIACRAQIRELST